ncbi:MAG: GntR family transcriptional regulator [Candidatus Izimaplasma sp.]|nr:GntR family transcriptional regulator [Candidatus Izimaplasma bacterium]
MMEYIQINKLLTTSIYKQIAASITQAIDRGDLKYNDKLPTEKEICQAFSISQTAVKMAYEKLINEEKIKRIKGKGTYVTNRDVYQGNLHNFYELELLEDKVTPKYNQKIVMFDKKTKDYGAYRELKIDKKEPTFQIIRVIRSGQNPVLLQKIFFPHKYFKNFEKQYQSFSNLFTFIEQTCNYKIAHLHSTFSAINASASEALLLRLEPDDALHYVRTKIVDKKGNIIAYIYNYFPGDFTEFEVIVHAI